MTVYDVEYKLKNDELKEKSREYFDRVALRDEVLPEPRLCYGAVLSKMELKTGMRIADIGCGTGGMLKEILDIAPEGTELYGVDISAGSLKAAARICGDRVTLINKDAEELPFDDESMDVLLCMHSFHHYPEPESCLKEMYRVLKDKGTLFLVENDYPLLRRIVYNMRFRLTGNHGGDIHMYSKKELGKMTAAAGFTAVLHESIADHSQMLICKKQVNAEAG